MARIAIVKVRSAHDIEWHMPKVASQLLGALRLDKLRGRLEAVDGLPFMPQLTLPYLAALGHRYAVQNGRSHHFELIDEPEERIDLRGYDMVWFTSVTPTAPAVYRLAERARAAGTLTVMGGIHATTCPEEAERHCDAIVIGEGEVAVPQILADYDRDGKLARRYQGGRDATLATLPVPRWKDAVIEDYAPWVVPVQTSRGCRNACYFCSTTGFQGARRRHRPVQEIVDEIRALRDQGVLGPDKVIFFTDNNIVSDSDHRNGVRDTAYARELFKGLAPLGQQWTGQGEVAVGDDPELTELLARSGCISLLVGFESINPANLSSVGKQHANNVDTYIRQIEMLHDYGMSIIGCFIFGLDNDTDETFETTAKFIEDHIDIPQVSLLTPFPGTLQYRQMKRDGRLLHEDWSKYDITNVVFRPRSMSPEALEEGFRWLTDRLYAYPEIMRRSLRHAARRTRYNIPSMTRRNRFTSVLSPNLVYRSLSRATSGKPKRTLLQGRLFDFGNEHRPEPAPI